MQKSNVAALLRSRLNHDFYAIDATPARPYSLVDLCTGQYCDPPKDKNAWSVVDGYKVVADQNPPDDCALDDETTTDTSSDTSDSSTEGGGGTLQESDGAASLVCGVGAAAAAAVLL